MMLPSISNVMYEYFSQPVRGQSLTETVSKSSPIVPKKILWKMTSDGSALMRTFSFEIEKHLQTFITDLLEMQAELQHHAQILIDEKSVKIRVGTKNLNRVTELDTEFVAKTDRLYVDVVGAEE